MSTADDKEIHIDESTHEYLTFYIAGQLFGIEVTHVHDVFQPRSMTPVPMAPPEVKGILNLRGRIITAIDGRERLGLPQTEEADHEPMAIGVEIGSESYALIIDSVGDVLRFAERDSEVIPSNIDPHWQDVSKLIYRLEEHLLIILDVHKMLSIDDAIARAA